MKKIKILVAQHKSSKVYSNDVYIPIHVGKSLSKSDLGIWGDNTGDNISHLNPYFCELTAQYWAWKNMPDVEYIGLCHYRRYFKTEFTIENIDSIMSNYDIILSRRIYLESNILNWYFKSLTPEDVNVFYIYMKHLYKNDIQLFNNFYIKKNWINPANMFVCKKELFDKFCTWQFKILSDLFSIIPQSPYTREKRLMGYLGESLLPFFAYENKLRIKELPLVPMIGDTKEYYKQNFLMKLKRQILFTKGRKNFSTPEDILGGLKADGILEKIDNSFNSKASDKLT